MSQGKTILVIDDEPKTTTYFTTLLADNGFSAHKANDADEGLRQLEACRPDLILLDLVMPEKTGINLFCKFINCPNSARYSSTWSRMVSFASVINNLCQLPTFDRLRQPNLVSQAHIFSPTAPLNG